MKTKVLLLLAACLLGISAILSWISLYQFTILYGAWQRGEMFCRPLFIMKCTTHYERARDILYGVLAISWFCMLGAILSVFVTLKARS